MSGATFVASKSQFLRKVISVPLVSAAMLALSTAFASAQLSTFGGNAQHTNVYTPAVQHMNRTNWTAAIDTSNSGAFAHYGEAIITAANTVIVPVLTSTSSVTLNAYNGATGAFKYNLATDYIMPSHSWIPEYQPVAVGTRLYYPGAGGTVYYVDNINGTPTAPTQLCFYTTLSNYTANAGGANGFNATVFIDTPITADSAGNIFFGFRLQAHSVNANVGTGANSATQNVNSTSGMSAGDVIHFSNENANRTILSVVDGTTVTLTASINSSSGESIYATTPPLAPLSLSSTTGRPLSGYARISSGGAGTFVTVDTMTGDANMGMDCHNAAPALSADESTLYVVGKQYNYSYNSYLCGLNTTTLATKYTRHVVDPRPGGSAAGPIDDSTATPLVAPDGDVYMGMFVTPYNGSRGFLAHYNADLSVVKTPGAFGWDFTPGIVPASMVPSYHGKSSYLLFCKYNNYDTGGGSADGGDEINTVAILDPNDETQIDWHPQAAGMVEMREVFTMIGPTANDEVPELNSVREWCINATAVNPATDSVFFNSEDGRTYRWNLGQNSLTECLRLTPGFGAPYVPAFIGPDGQEYTLNGTSIYANGQVPGITVTLDSDHPDARTTVVGDNITFTAHVTDPAATGASTVTFIDEAYDNYTAVDTVLGTVPLVSGTASLSSATLKAGVYNSGADIYLGSHFITATYNQSGTYNVNNPSIVRVQKLHYFASATTGNAGSPTLTYGSPETLNANVVSVPAASGDPVKGMVAFVDSDGSVVGQGHTDGSGNVSVTTSTLKPGVHTLHAVFNGDTEFATSSSSTFQVTVKGTLTGFTASPLTVRGGGTSTGTLTINAAAAPGGDPITVSSNSPYATVTTPAPIAAGQTTATFVIHTNNNTTSNQTAIITATDNNSLTQTITIQPGNYSSYVSQTVPTAMTAGQSYGVTISYKNTGTTTWTSAAGYKLQSRSPVDNMNWGMNRIPLVNGPVAPNGTAIFKANVIAPATNGTYAFQWETMQDVAGIGGFGPATPAVNVVVTKVADAAQFVSDTAPLALNAGQDFTPTITFKNVGTNTWSAASGYHLISRNGYNNTTWGTNNVALPASVAPGSSVGFTRAFTAPVVPGTYNWQWSMIHTATLFGDLSVNKAIVVSQGPDNATLVSQSVPTSVGPSSTFTASVTMKNMGTATWTGPTYALKSQNPAGNTTWGVSSIPVSGSVANSANATFSATFTAPATPGTYNFQWRMADGTTAFGQYSTNVPIVVSPDAAIWVSTSSQPSTIVAGKDFYAQYTMKNTGTSTWSAAAGYSLKSVGPNSTVWNRSTINLPAGTVAPGATVVLTGLCMSPVTPGTYVLQWQMQKSGVLFGGTTPAASIVVTQGADDAQFISQTGVPTTIVHGTAFNVTVQMQNLGTGTWDGTYQLQSQNPASNTTWGTSAIAVSGTVAPNATYNFVHSFTAPVTPGTYNFQWRMFHTGNGVFGSYTTNVSIVVT